jgi:hypothetical protein
MMQAQNSRLFGGDPNNPISRMHKQLERMKESRMKELNRTKTGFANENKSYVLYVEVCNIVPTIWRRIRVPANITFNLLHDKVLAPAIGWCRDYHGYYFQELPLPDQRNLPRFVRGVGIAFGPVASRAVDMMHCGIHGIELIDDNEYKLGQILNKVNQKLRYVYDIGDTFIHKITLEKIESGDPQRIELIGGERACPPEDCGSLYSYAEKLDILADPKHPKYKETLRTASHSANYKNDPEPFDPNRFNLSQRQKFVQMTLKKETKNRGSNMVFHSFQSGTTQFPTFEDSKYVAPRKECGVCGAHENLKRCGKCKIKYYCSRKHQEEDWPKHKLECGKIVN